ncbi:MAG: response regulator [Deltaproteobacteria bacterium]|nr:response regulator [Nannocystaceae bacterium]
MVDDDDAMRELVCSALEAEGYDVDAADHGGAALERLREAEQPDLVLLDLEMPVMDGWQLIDEMRAMDSCNAIPVLVMSGSTPAEAPAGFPFIAKPASVSGLLAAVHRATRGPRRRKRRALYRSTHSS